MFGAIMLPHDIIVALDRLDGVAKAKDRGPITGIQGLPVGELAQHRLERRAVRRSLVDPGQ